MLKKIDQLRHLMNNQEWEKAVSLASKFPRLGSHKIPIQRGHEAFIRPDFYKQMGYNLDSLKQEAINALKARYP